ncbi:alpha/beta hydrolase [Patescibacteria group bacterium]|nr:alpha/beta hydrolase [Patescibacteria group bacterium]
MKRAIIVHGWDGKPEHGWYLWLKSELDKKGFQTKVPQMPNTSEPKINPWVSKLKSVAGSVNEETILIGHSIGCQTVLRYLEKLPKGVKIGKCILVASWMELDRGTIEEEGEEIKEIAKPWIETPIDWKKVKEHCKEFIAIFSDNDPYVPLYNAASFKRNLNAKTIILKRRGHFTEDDGAKKLPEVLDYIK